MKRVLLIAVALPMMAQNPAPPAPSAAAPAESPVPARENWLTGWIELGYRWNTGPGGSFETYRSVVDLGAGPKLVGTDFTIVDPKRRLFDDIHVQAYDWTDPYSTLRVDAAKQSAYRFSASYRSLAYFNNLPSYADPLLTRGIMLDEQSFDMRRHLASMELHILPQRRFSPYVGFDHDGNSGHGASTFVTNGDEYSVPYATTDITNVYRGGLNIVLPRTHLTLEEGGTTYRSNQNNYATGLNPGNSNVPVLGQTLDLTGLAQAWGIRGSSTWTRAVLTANPFSWLDVYGHFGYVDSHNDINYTQLDTGSLVLLSQVLFYSGEQFIQTAAARMPHSSGDAGWEIRPFKRLRFQQYWLTDRLHNSGLSHGTDTLFASGATLPLSLAFNSFLATNYNQTETGLSFNASSKITLRAAYRYIWGDANDLVLPQTGLLTVQSSRLRRNAVLGSASWHVFQKLLASGNFEWGSSGRQYFRTSLYDYRKARLSVRYDVSSSLHLGADYMILANQNPLAGSPYKFLSHQESFSLQWAPSARKVDLIGTYEHCGYHTQIEYLDPGTLLSAISNYREYCHDVTATANAVLPGFLNHGRISAGGSALLTSGSRPTTYYQPLAKVTVPITERIGWFAVWQYYGFGETYYVYENFRTNLFTVGLRFSR
jgi:hypothetical protein